MPLVRHGPGKEVIAAFQSWHPRSTTDAIHSARRAGHDATSQADTIEGLVPVNGNCGHSRGSHHLRKFGIPMELPLLLVRNLLL
jgi:hypothetical protein